MQSWQIDILKMLAAAVIAGVGGWWGYHRWSREERLKAERREQERQAEYEDFKRRRRLSGAKPTERVALLQTHADLLIKMKDRGISEEAVYDLMEFSMTGNLPPVTETPRTNEEIDQAIDELRDRLWWDRHKTLEQLVELGYERPDPDNWEKSRQEVARIEKKYGLANLGWDKFDAGMIEGKVAALLWVLGEKWDHLGKKEGAGYVRPYLRQFAADLEQIVDDYQKLMDEPIENPRGGNPVRHRLQSMVFSVLVLIDNARTDRIVEELHEIYARFAWREPREAEQK